MTWVYVQRTGRLEHNGVAKAFGYSGKGIGKNNPEMQHVPNVGPLPCGWYTIGRPYNSKLRGPFCIPLTPDAENEMFGRSTFLVHGDSLHDPGNASEGCMIQGRNTRGSMDGSGDNRLLVVADEKDIPR